jgi:hypothetical protein
MKTPNHIKAFLIDPFQHEIYPVSVENAPGAVAEILDCELIQAVGLGIMTANGVDHVAWVDDEGLLRQPFVYPHFIIKTANGGQPMAGYGLVTGIRDNGETTNCQLAYADLAQLTGFEPWRSRISIDDVIPQMLRLYKLAK